VPVPRVLIVHDERIIADTLAQILAQSGYQARAVYSGEQAVQAASESSPDVLIADVVMQGMNGVEAALLIRQISPQCHVLLSQAKPPLRTCFPEQAPMVTRSRYWPSLCPRRLSSLA